MPRNRDQQLLRDVGQRVSRARRDRGWSQELLAEAIGIQPTTLSRLETGDRAVSLSTLGRIAEALGVGLGDLLDVERDLPTIDHGPDTPNFCGASTRSPQVAVSLSSGWCASWRSWRSRFV